MQKSSIVRHTTRFGNPVGPYLRVTEKCNDSVETVLSGDRLRRVYRESDLTEYVTISIQVSELEAKTLERNSVLRKPLTKSIVKKIDTFNYLQQRSKVHGILHIYRQNFHKYYVLVSINEFANCIETKTGIKYIPIVKIVTGELIREL